ncbi:MmcQ/YjbR family DNA-binding protein [Sphaerisporangium sp. TRM90804]|uniref:MmcQ/YjbR family DNA-binding protein n=1 Tax=Sphaerisporangium sp. TRM90804 TaxID=3031113 RepID=UPI0024491627|nr:MmcQ/YjbR family DNA-binding protein [Sphaerisporangium sp. TRM90804]MDH2429122.1 MmcQ/YjbR family DNA-binding protein [Sphaerisporangium sp. TRM90804]
MGPPIRSCFQCERSRGESEWSRSGNKRFAVAGRRHGCDRPRRRDGVARVRGVSVGAASVAVQWEAPGRLPGGYSEGVGVVTVDDVRRLAVTLPRTEEKVVRDHVTFRVGRIVYLGISPDETLMGFAFPKEERAALVAAEPGKFRMPIRSDERYNWVRVWLAAIDEPEMREIVVDAWRMVVPKRVAAAYIP